MEEINMPKLKHTNLSPSEIASIDNLHANTNLNLEHDNYSSEVVRLLREEDITLCHELAVHREVLTLIINQIGITHEEFEELCKKVKEAKEKAKEAQNNKGE